MMRRLFWQRNEKDRPSVPEMYQDYIDGKKELREINMEFNTRYTLGDSGRDRGACEYR